MNRTNRSGLALLLLGLTALISYGIAAPNEQLAARDVIIAAAIVFGIGLFVGDEKQP